MEESLEQEARQRRTDQRRSEASVVGPLRDEVGYLQNSSMLDYSNLRSVSINSAHFLSLVPTY